MDRLSFFVPDNPKPKGRARVAVRGDRAYAYTPSATLQSEWRIREHVSSQGPAPLEGALKLALVVALPPPAMPKKWQGVRQPTKRPDLDNFIKTVLDALNGLAYKDDSQIVSINATKVYAWDGGYKPGWYIYLSSVGC